MNRRRRAGVGALFDSDDLPGCEIYVALRDRINVRCAAARAHCEELWQCFQRHADRNYIPEFRLRLHQRWFEMYLTVALKRAGYSIEDVGTGPDICASIGGRRVWIEATCSEPGASDNPDAVPAKVYDQVQGAPINQMTLRILNSLDVKQEKLAKYRALGTIGDSDIALVAINIFEVPGGFEDVSIAFERALFGFAGTEVIIDRQSGREIHRRRRHQVEITRSKSGKPVDVQPFANDKLPHVAGVLASGMSVLNCDWPPARLGASLIAYPNMGATTPLSADLIELGVATVPELDADGAWHFRQVDHERHRD